MRWYLNVCWQLPVHYSDFVLVGDDKGISTCLLFVLWFTRHNNWVNVNRCKLWLMMRLRRGRLTKQNEVLTDDSRHILLMYECLRGVLITRPVSACWKWRVRRRSLMWCIIMMTYQESLIWRLFRLINDIIMRLHFLNGQCKCSAWPVMFELRNLPAKVDTEHYIIH